MNSKLKRKKEARSFKQSNYNNKQPFRRDPSAKAEGTGRGYYQNRGRGSYQNRGARYTRSQGRSIKLVTKTKPVCPNTSVKKPSANPVRIKLTSSANKGTNTKPQSTNPLRGDTMPGRGKNQCVPRKLESAHSEPGNIKPSKGNRASVRSKSFANQGTQRPEIQSKRIKINLIRGTTNVIKKGP